MNPSRAKNESMRTLLGGEEGGGRYVTSGLNYERGGDGRKMQRQYSTDETRKKIP